MTKDTNAANRFGAPSDRERAKALEKSKAKEKRQSTRDTGKVSHVFSAHAHFMLYFFLVNHPSMMFKLMLV